MIIIQGQFVEGSEFHMDHVVKLCVQQKSKGVKYDQNR